MNNELKFWMSITRRLPRIKGAGLITRTVQCIYARKARARVQVPVLDFKMDLDPNECLDGFLLFAPHLYDYREFEVLQRSVRPGDVFLDAGSNVGLYTLVVSRLVGDSGKVLAIEASETNFSYLRLNCELNRARNVKCVQVGVSDRVEKLRLACSTWGNRGGNSFLKNSSVGEDVACKPLWDVLMGEGLDGIDVAKFDIEGFEFKVLKAFLEDAPPSAWPRLLIFERNMDLEDKSGGDVRSLLTEAGYDVRPIADQNYVAEKRLS